ncbi:type II restriction endonuclease [Vibrio vulnificus]|uniref:Restriction endonuclease n=1 Tax=Vibrio vulnificus TaxID=672 RepID=A0AAN1PRG3_VIBVL|nr:type II restriction endonuclease [Vibrio vulnificus]EWS66906.1 restriction endonuclease [Vibrio vulnificus BAA87]AXX61604.1 hypothetical protein FORC53_3265 [Vibrio vulnificus]MCU8177497.1 type II restriction endonuclease [Vibrio vulnificus]MDS1782656.1 type II restriction endonuclease [Vibrio vulnificus]MDS1809991.1 type II restriction endonuclease [Vibrio vulnificus]
MSDFRSWLSDKVSDSWLVYIKRLSANDTGATGGHQVGVYIPKEVMNTLFPSIDRTDIENPDYELTAKMMSHSFPEQRVRAIYYNGKFFGKTRNEKRITRWGGKKSPLQDVENTGSLAIFSFRKDSHDCDLTEVWVCRSVEDEEELESMIGEVLPGYTLFGPGSSILGGFAVSYDWKSGEYPIPPEWHVSFPSGAQIIDYLPNIFRLTVAGADKQLLERRNAEYSLFRKVEEIHVLDKIREGFDSVDDFISLANSVSNRRKSRSGRSLEIHLENIFTEEGLVTFDTQSVTENNKKPDFLFPSGEAYHNLSYPAEKLRMLAVKTTCKDRWRQVLNEANRIDNIHLFTLQEGVSLNQFGEMTAAGVQLIVPEPLHKCYPKDIRDELMSLNDFIQETKELYC